MQNTAFNSSLGTFSIDASGEPASKTYRVANFQGKDLVDVYKIAMFDTFNASVVPIPNTKVYFTQARTTTPPADSAVLQDVSITYRQGGPIFFIVYYMINLLLTLVTGAIVFMRRDRPVVKNMSLPFLMLMTVRVEFLNKYCSFPHLSSPP